MVIQGITRPISFEVECLGPVKSPFSGKSSIGFRGATKIDREDYGIVLDLTMEGGGLVLGKEVEITFDLQADLANRTRPLQKRTWANRSTRLRKAIDLTL